MEKYLLDQAKLAKQKKLLKKNKVINENKKKRKISNSSAEDPNKNKANSPAKKRKKTPDPKVQKKVQVTHGSKKEEHANDGSDSEYMPSESDYDSESSKESVKTSKASVSKKKNSKTKKGQFENQFLNQILLICLIFQQLLKRRIFDRWSLK